MFGIKEKINMASLRQQSAENWIVMGWNFLAGLFVLVSIIVVIASYSHRKFIRPVGSKSPVNELAAAPVQNLESQPWAGFDSYEPSFANRDIFVSQEEKAAAATQMPTQPAVPAVQWGEGYQLAGVIVDKNPTAIVKVSNPPGVVTLNVGESLGGAVLKNVKENNAIFDYQGQIVTLSLEGAKAP